MQTRVSFTLLALGALAATCGETRAGELSVGGKSIIAGTTDDVVVSGLLTSENTFGVTILIELVPQGGNTGTLTFTPSPPSDIVQVNDLWPTGGTFTVFDADAPGFSSTVNGIVDDDGRFLCDTPMTYSGPLVSFPIVASSDASGVWDAVLSTSVGDSLWECTSTTRVPATITVLQAECFFDSDCDDGVACTDDTCVSNTCVATPNNANCTDNLVFCDGPEICDAALDCVSSGNPCQPGEFCNEGTDSCDECQFDTDCDDGVACTDDSCIGGVCDYFANNTNCVDDLLFCTGVESCDAVSGCVSSGSPCQVGRICDETNDLCTNCTLASQCDDGNVCTNDACVVGLCTHGNNTAACDDGLFCTLNDVCSGGACTGSGNTCVGQLCDEDNDVCLPEAASISAPDLVLLRGETVQMEIVGAIAGEATIGVTVMVQIVPRAGTLGSMEFTPAPPSDIVQLGDPWLGTGTYSTFDTDAAGFGPDTNGSVDDNGTFIPSPVTYSGPLTGFPVTASSDAGGIWDVVLTTPAGDSGWEGVTTVLKAGTLSVAPPAAIAVTSRAMPPSSTVDVIVSGSLETELGSSVDVLLEIVPRVGNTGILEFTPAFDIAELDNPWGGTGTFSAFDVSAMGFSSTLNGSVHGTFIPAVITFDGLLTAFPVVSSADADGVWDLVLQTSAGDSGWNGVLTALSPGTITVSASSCVVDIDCDDANSCTSGVCILGTCQYTNVVGACDDGDLCTINDTCFGSLCIGTPLDCSSADDACNLGVCNALTGVCEGQPANEGGACDDGALCTGPDTCTSGVCGGPATDCTSLDDACNVGVCNVSTGACETASANDGGACDDLDPCTVNDVCFNGTCSGTDADCSSFTDDCNIGACNPATGVCEGVHFNEGLTCNDGDLCTVNDRCSAGNCAGTATNCSGFADACNDGVCNPATGACQSIPANEGGTCDDGDPCTSTDTCAAGSCAGTSIPGCVNCDFDQDCDDGIFCTGDTCVGGVCQHTNLTIACNDGVPCTQNDVCSGGLCAGTPRDCSHLDGPCNVGVCQASTGLCRRQPANDGGACDDGYACTVNDQCNSGVCTGTLVDPKEVDLGWSPSSLVVQGGATFQVHLIATSATCMNQPTGSIEIILNWDPTFLELVDQIDSGPVNWLISGFPDDSGVDGLNVPFDGTVANDGDALYQALSGLQSGAQVSPSGIVVTTFEFKALDGTLDTPISIAPSQGLFTVTRVIGAGIDLGLDVTGNLGSVSVQVTECQNNQECDDDNVCTTDTCVAGICQYANNTISCDDGLFCTSGDTCSGGACVGGADPCFNPLLCSESLDACVVCLGPADCADGNICTDDLCDAFGNCSNPNNTVPCDDGVFCTLTDTCSGGVCVGSGDTCPGEVCDEPTDRCVECLSAGDCDDANVCTTDSCVGNLCNHTANTLPCDDGLFCTTTDVCAAGVCVGATDPCTAPLICSESQNNCVECELNQHCDDGNLCTTDVCFFNICSNTNNVAPCDDGLFCTTTDVCSGGTCVGTGTPCPGQLCDEAGTTCVDCFTVADCPDDFVGCTIDSCVDGSCVHETSDALCDDALFCNGPEFCHAVLDCQGGTSPCDDPALCNEVNQSCGCQEPEIIAEGSRYLAVTPRAGQTQVALLISGLDAGVSCLSKYVQADGRLGTQPVFKAPRGPSGWNTVHVRGLDIIPSTTYTVQAACDTGQGPGISTAAQDTTWIWGDTDHSGGLVDIRDVTLVANGFQGDFSLITRYNVDLWGRLSDDCTPSLTIDIIDILKALEGFQQFPFPCPDPCP